MLQGVSPPNVRREASAPPATRARTVSTSPRRAASCSAAQPFSSTSFASAPCASMASTPAASPSLDRSRSRRLRSSFGAPSGSRSSSAYDCTGSSMPLCSRGGSKPKPCQYSVKLRRKGGGPAASTTGRPVVASKSGGTETCVSHMVQFHPCAGNQWRNTDAYARPRMGCRRAWYILALSYMQSSPGLRFTRFQLPSASSISSGQGSSRSRSMWKMAEMTCVSDLSTWFTSVEPLP
mmetsp:Transcript_9601/g.28728  ORF Transcript_9601/g.28728 Transcript_9601/m.28728 type:complete len:236 (+) Transcript_9601:89-796(+)